MKYILSGKYSVRNLVIVSIGVVLYWVLFITLHEVLKINPVPLVILPIVASCWFWGTKRGILAGAFILLTTLFFIIVFHIHRASAAGGALAIAISFSLGSAAGWARKLYEREKRYSKMLAGERKALLREVEERRKAEKKVLWDEYFLKTMSNSSPMGMLAINNETDEVLYCNHRFCEIWNVEKFENKVVIKEIKSSEFIDLCHANLKDFDFYKKHFSPSLDVNSLDTTTIDIQFKDGRIIRRFTSAIMGKNDEYLGRLFLYEDITDRKKSEYQLKRRSEYEHLIYSVSNLFVKEPADKIDEVFIASIRETGEFLGMDMGYFYKVNQESGIAENLYEWRSSRVNMDLDKVFRLDFSLSPAFMEKLKNFEKVVIPDTEALPSGKRVEKEFMLRRRIKAVVAFPVVFNNNLIGFLGFSSHTPKQFPEDAASMLKIISDIFAGAFMRKQKTDDLLVSEERFRLLVQNSADMITVVDTEGRLTYTSEAVGRILGYKSGERNGLSIEQFVHPDDVTKITGTLKMFLSKTRSSSDPQYIRVRHTNGQWVYLESIFTDQMDNPAINGIVINSRDFTQHLALHEALRNSRNFLNAVINSASDPMFVKDSSFKWVIVNDAFCRLTGYKREDMVGRTAFELFPREEAESFSHKNELALNLDESKDYEICFTDAHGNKHVIVSHLNTFEEESGEKYIIANLRDETRRKELELEINNALMREKELNMLKSKFVSMVSHEYRTPLTAILSSAELIELFGPDMDITEMQEYLENIVKSVDYLTSLLDDVLLINRAESGRLEYYPSSFELIEFCREILKDLMDAAGGMVELESSFASKTVVMDKKLLRHILMNLLTNAVKYSDEGKTVLFTVNHSQGQVVFDIKDKGIGILPEDQVHLFEPFFRGDNVSNIPGTGLGLSIVKHCVDLHNGSISFESNAGKGTKFTVSLPDKRKKL